MHGCAHMWSGLKLGFPFSDVQLATRITQHAIRSMQLAACSTQKAARHVARTTPCCTWSAPMTLNSMIRETMLKRILLNNSNLNHQIRPEGGQLPGGRGLAAQRAYRYDPLTAPNYYPFSVPLIMEFTTSQVQLFQLSVKVILSQTRSALTCNEWMNEWMNNEIYWNQRNAVTTEGRYGQLKELSLHPETVVLYWHFGFLQTT
jgi:hypothetical protein